MEPGKLHGQTTQDEERSKGTLERGIPKGWIKLEDYKLKMTDTKETRNYPDSFKIETLVTLEDLKGDMRRENKGGTTETDSQTDPRQPGYTRLYDNHRLQHMRNRGDGYGHTRADKKKH